MDIGSCFKNFCDKLKLSNGDETLKTSRFHSITKRINLDFWGTDSDTYHSFYTGSHGRGTDIYTSDIDMVVVLPYSIYSKYNSYLFNGQSQLLQAVKESISKTYPSTSISGDGQVVDVVFSDGMKFEVVPAFINSDNTTYTYPDTHDGGSWRVMNPKNEITVFNAMNTATNGNLKNFCKMIREWNKINNVFIPGILIDTLVYNFLKNYEYNDKSYLYYDWFTRDFMQYLISNHEQSKWLVPGGNWYASRVYSFNREAKDAYEHAVNAIEYATKKYDYSCGEEWKKIYGSKF